MRKLMWAFRDYRNAPKMAAHLHTDKNNGFVTVFKLINYLYIHICYKIQLMHYSHFKTQSLQHLKQIKC